MNRIIFISFLLFINHGLHANSDSLINILNKSKVDTTRFQLMDEISRANFFNNQNISEKYSRKLIQEAKEKSNLKWIGSGYILLGNIKYIWADYDSSYFYFEKALFYHKKIKDKKSIAALTSNLGMLHNEKGEFDEALKKFNLCLVMDKKNKDIAGISGDYNNIGISHWNKGEMQKAIDAYLLSIKYAEKINNEHIKGQGLNNIGIIYRLVKNYKEALKYHNESAAIFLKLKDDRTLANIYSNIGLVYEESEIFDSARFYQEKALKISLDNNDKAGAAIRYNNLGVLFEEEKDYLKAIELHRQSLKIKEEIKDVTGISYSKANIGMLLNKLNKFSEAVSYCEDALKISKKYKSIETERVACGCLYEANKGLGNFKLSLYFHERERSLNDSLSSNEQASELAKKETAFRYEKIAAEDSIRNLEERKVTEAQIKAQEEQIKREQEELKAERLMKYSLYGGLFLVLVFAIVVYNRFKLTRKQKGIIEYQMAVVEEQHTEIKQSISYAKRIQDALLKEENILKQDIPPHFVFYKPKDVLSGDFYWQGEKDDWWYVCVGDCTGHGVPGALLTMLGLSYLNELISLPERIKPNEMLNRLREKVVKQLGQSGNDGTTKDGMDISLLAIHKKTKECEWAGANNPLWIYRDKNNPVSFGLDNDGQRKIKLSQIENYHLLELIGDKQPIGIYDNMNDFGCYELKLQPGDGIYLFSDGFPDQFGSDNHKKLKSSNFKKLLATVCPDDIRLQPEKIEKFFNEWKGDLEQIDDVCVIGIKI